MELEIESLKAAGADGFVFGLLTSDGHVDAANCQRLVQLCKPLPVTFHRAFDVCAYWPRALSEIRAAGFLASSLPVRQNRRTRDAPI